MDKLLTPLSIIIAGGLIAFAVVFSGNPAVLGQKSAPSIQEVAPLGEQVPTQQVQAPVAPSVVTVSFDDDAVLGDPNAPVTIVEFSDYECPFCKRFWEES